jgi:LEA14-like dessication related protein
MQFQSLDVVGPTRRGFNMGVNLNAQNPNSVPGKIKAFYYKLEVDTFYLGSGTYYCNTLLPPGGNADSRVDVNISYDRLGPAAAALVQRGEVPYRVRGYYVLEAEGGRSIEPVLTTGRFNVSEALRPWMGMFR